MIYFIRNPASNDIKIGFAKNPWSRLAYLQVGVAAPLELRAIIEGDRAQERELHQSFASLRIRGEWFAFSGALATLVKSLPVPVRPVAAREEAPARQEPFARVIWRNGGPKVFAAKLGVPRCNVQMWAFRNAIPAEYWMTLVRLDAATLEELALAAESRLSDATREAA